MSWESFGGFDPEKVAQTFLEALRGRRLRVSREQLRVAMIGGVGQIGLPLAEDYAPLPHEGEWRRMTSGLEAPPAWPAPRFMLWGYARPALETRDEVPRIHFHVVLVQEEG